MRIDAKNATISVCRRSAECCPFLRAAYPERTIYCYQHSDAGQVPDEVFAPAWLMLIVPHLGSFWALVGTACTVKARSVAAPAKPTV